ncbi:MAG: hypothetical protein HYW38_00600 [Candidatus Colwellbacteria bacterium]|nr:hypothetical protein [Candidatus Colwellbacteria bacterium]
METNNLSREQLVSLAQFLEGQERAYETNKLALYQPKAGLQDAFHRSNKKIRLLVTGNRGGKTTCITIEAIWLALGIHPHHPIPVPNRGKLYGESYPAIMESIKMKFDEWCPLIYLHPTRPYSKNQLGQITGVNFKNGSIIRFGTYDQQAEKSESSNWHYVGFDEPPGRNLYIANLRAITDFGGIMWFSMTPLSEPWIYDELWIPGITGEKKHIECFNWSTDKNPFLNKEGMELFFSEMTEDEKEVRFKGKFMRLKGLVIDTYDPELSDVEPFILDSGFCIYEGLDPHPRKPNATLWKAINRDGFRYAVRELYFDGGIYEWGQRIAEVRRELRSHGAHFTRSIADTSLNQKDCLGCKNSVIFFVLFN